MKRPSLWLLLPLLAVAGAAPAQEAGTLAKVRERGVFAIGYRESSIPFSYLDASARPVGYTMDLCARIVDAVKAELALPQLRVEQVPVTSSNRIPLLMNGTIDLECGSTTNSMERQKQVAFSPNTFVVNVSAAVKKDSPVKTFADLDGRVIATTAGTTSVPLLAAYGKTRAIHVTEILGKDHAESFLLMSSGRAAAFVMDDVLLAGQIASAPMPGDYRILAESLRQEPYGIMLRKGDGPFKALVDRTITGLMRSGEIERIYAKWFTQPIPPRNINLDFPPSPAIREAFRNPSDKGI